MNIPADTLWNSLPVPAFVADAQDVIRAANPAGEQFLNLSARRLVGSPILDRLAIDAPLEGALARVRADHSAVFIKNADVSGGNDAPVSCNIQIAPMIGSDGDVLLILEPRKLSDRLGQSQALKSSTRSAIGMAEMLSHEIKNPLAGITGAAQLLAMNLDSADREMTDLIVAESRRIVALLDQVEQFGNLRPPDRRPVNIHDILDQARRSASVGFGAHMQITDDFDPSLPPTLVDRDQMMQVILNLLRNAAEASRDRRGKILIRTYYDLGLRLRRQDGPGDKTSAPLPLQIEIIDDGPGLPADIAADVFEPFVSGRENGTGLGLALVGKIISDHGGWISVETTPGRTVFRISLPLAPTGTNDGDAEQADLAKTDRKDT